MAVSSSSAGPTGVFAVWLHDGAGNRVALVDVPVPMPLIVLFNGSYYAWSFHVYWRYVLFTPYAAQADLGAPQLSVVCEPMQTSSY